MHVLFLVWSLRDANVIKSKPNLHENWSIQTQFWSIYDISCEQYYEKPILSRQIAILMNQYTTRKGLIKNPQRFFAANRKPFS